MQQVSLSIDTVNHVLNFMRSTGLPMGSLIADRILAEVNAPLQEAQKQQEIQQAVAQAREALEKESEEKATASHAATAEADAPAPSVNDVLTEQKAGNVETSRSRRGRVGAE